MAKHKRQLRLLGENPPETAALFDSTEFPYDTPDEIAYNAKRKAEGLFELNTEEEETNDKSHDRAVGKQRATRQ